MISSIALVWASKAIELRNQSLRSMLSPGLVAFGGFQLFIHVLSGRLFKYSRPDLIDNEIFYGVVYNSED